MRDDVKRRAKGWEGERGREEEEVVEEERKRGKMVLSPGLG